MECLQIDLNNICRICKCDSPEMKSLYSRDSDSGQENPRLDEMLMACASIQVSSEDGLPKSICRLCFVQLKNAYCFKEQCERTDIFLRNYVKNLKKEIKEETAINDYSLHEINTNLSNVSEEAKLEINVIKDDPELGDIRYKDVDFVQIIDNDLGIYQCKTCSKGFLTLESLTAHKRIHTERSFKCKQCNKSYTRLYHLHRHEMSHGKRKVHVCKICNKTLTRLEHLKRHLVTHLKEKPFGCPTCNRGFNRAEHLQNHIKCCKGEIMHICEICNKCFNREESLEVHRRAHENKMPVLPTLENLDNIEEHYMEIDCGDDDNDNNDGGSAIDNNISLSDDHSEADTIEEEVEVSENNDQEKIAKIAQIANEIYVEEDPLDMLIEKAKIEEEMYLEQVKEENEEEEEAENGLSMDGDSYGPEIDNGNDYQSDNSVHSEYLPTRKKKSPKIKRGRGRPRKYPIGYKQTEGRHRGRPPLKSKIKTEESNMSSFPCPETKKIFTKMSSLARHAEHHKGLKIYECETCNKKFNKSNSLNRHKLSHNDVKRFLCVTCQKGFSRRDHLQRHMKTHLNANNGDTARKHKCDLCGTMFSRPENLAKHKAYMHNVGEKVAIAEKKYKCNYCHRGFTTEKYLDAHTKVHFDDKKFQCKTCDKSFISKSHLTEHMKFHNESSKKFLCSECGQRFIRNDYLIIHMRRHRGEKPFKCKFCGKGFPRTSDLTVHERYHTGEKTHLCVVCGRGFERAYKLTVHMRTHTGEKPYRCTYCDAAFAQGNDLKAHVRRHTGERFQCELCPKMYLMSYLLKQHKRVVHGLNVVSNIRRLQPVKKFNTDDSPPTTISLPTPVVIPKAIVSSTFSAATATTTTTTDPLQTQQMEVLDA